MPNKLIGETSPYLLQHANNPVDWYPWSEEALTKAKEEDKPILLSIGYSACHWCHVMEHESFEDKDTARLMNEWFVSIKVDREERPDLDSIYMQAVQALTGQGGWPMTVFLTPDLVPFFGGTYYPPTPRHGMPSFQQVLHGVASAYRDRRQEVEQGAERLLAHLSKTLAVPADTGGLRVETLEAAHHALAREFDPVHGGFGNKPKFPPAMDLEFLLRMYHRAGWTKAWEMVDLTLRKMAQGGMYDQLGGGFHRYSVDERWLVPHFEKMLYDNALLSRVYLHAYQASGDPFFRRVVEETLDYVLREMTSPKGGFYSTQDADSEGEEGRFFVWTVDEVEALLGSEDGPLFRAYFDVTDAGNFEHKNILHVDHGLEEVAARLSVTPELLSEVIERGKRILFEAREKRVKPGRDDKILTAWNGLMLAAFAEAARVLGREDYQAVAERNADFLLHQLRTPEGRLYHTWQARPEQVEGAGKAKVNGYLEDYTHLIEGLLELYQTTFESRWFVAAQGLVETLIAHFSVSDGGNASRTAGFYDTSDDHETLIIRPRDLEDNATPSGNAMAATVLLKLAGFTNDLRYVDMAHQTLAQIQSMMARYPLGFGQWLQALSYALSKPREIAIIGEPESADTQTLLSVVRSGYQPFQAVALGAPDAQSPEVPLLQDRSMIDGQATAYVCRNFTCQAPVTESRALQSLLETQ